MPNNSLTTGTVYLVGAGPGHPGLITLRGVECLQIADVVLYDYLVNPFILSHVRPDCKQICLGQHGRSRIWPQQEINQQLVDLARQGKNVVRLKGGDPAVFARGAEEAETLSQNNVPFEIVPGITAALAAGSCAGIPVTHREMASAVALITGQEHPGKDSSSLDWEALARFPGTLVFYMGMTTAGQWTSSLINAGKPSDTPCAIIRRCSHPDQESVHCQLDKVELTIRDEHIRPPSIVIVGQVVELSKTLSWFERRPLFGVRVMVTRAQHQAETLRRRLDELGAEVLVQPAIEISAPDDWLAVDQALDGLLDYDWLVFSSSNGVRFFMDRLLATTDLRVLGGVEIAAIGPGTAEELARYHLKADLQPDEFRAESLAEALGKEAKAGSRFLLIRASRGREVLNEQLVAAGGIVTHVVVYSSTDVKSPDSGIQAAIDGGRIDWITVTSSAIARSLAAMFGDTLSRFKLASISPVTSDTLRTLGFQPAAEAETYTMAGLVDAILHKTQQQS